MNWSSVGQLVARELSIENLMIKLTHVLSARKLIVFCAKIKHILIGLVINSRLSSKETMPTQLQITNLFKN